MNLTNVVFEGGTKDGTTAEYENLDTESNLLFNPAFEPEELYERTNKTVVIDGVERVVFRLKA